MSNFLTKEEIMKESRVNLRAIKSGAILFTLFLSLFIGCSGIGTIEKSISGLDVSQNVERSNLVIKFVTTPTFEGDYTLNLSIENTETSSVVFEDSEALSYAPATSDSPSEISVTFNTELAYGTYSFSMELLSESNVLASDSQTVTLNQPDVNLLFTLNLEGIAFSTTIELGSSVSMTAAINHAPVITLNTINDSEEQVLGVNFNESDFVIVVPVGALQINDPETGNMCSSAASYENLIYDGNPPYSNYIMKWVDCGNIVFHSITNAAFEYGSENNCEFSITIPNTLEYFDYESSSAASQDISNFQSCSLNIVALDQFGADAVLTTTFNLP